MKENQRQLNWNDVVSVLYLAILIVTQDTHL